MAPPTLSRAHHRSSRHVAAAKQLKFEAHRQRVRLLALMMLAQRRGVPLSPHLLPLWALASPLQICSVLAIQRAYRSQLARRRAALRLQRLMRKRGPHPSGVRPFISTLRYQFHLVSAFSLTSLVIFEVALMVKRSRAANLAHTISNLPYNLYLVHVIYSYLRRGSAGQVDNDQDRSGMLDALAASALCYIITLLVRYMCEADELALEMRISDEFLGLRSIHMAVIIGISSCSNQAHRLYSTQMTYLLFLLSFVRSHCMPDKSLAFMMLRGPVIFMAADVLARKLSVEAIRHTSARENTMGELGFALDVTNSPCPLAELVDVSAIQREWEEGLCSRIAGSVVAHNLFIHCLAKLIWTCVSSGDNVPISFFTTRISILLPTVGVLGYLFAKLSPSRRAGHQARRAITVLLFGVHIVHACQASLDIVSALRTRSVSVVEHLAASNASDPSLDEVEPQCRIGFLGTQAVGSHTALLATLLESMMAFGRGLVWAVLPLPPRLRATLVFVACLKQTLWSIHHAIIMDETEAALGAFWRELTLSLLGVATVSAVHVDRGRERRCCPPRSLYRASESATTPRDTVKSASMPVIDSRPGFCHVSPTRVSISSRASPRFPTRS